MNTVYTLSPKGQRECAAEHPMLLRELHELLRMVDGRRTRADLLATVGKNAITMGGLRWLTASGYIHPSPIATLSGPDSGAQWLAAAPPSELLASVPQDLSSRAALMSQRGALQLRDALVDFMLRSIARHLGEAGDPYRRRVERAGAVTDLLPLLNPVLEAILARAGSQAAAEFADTAALLLRPPEQRTQ